MAKPAPRKDGGYVLITVLVLALAASMVTFVAIKESRLQERMSGNQQKMINARLAAEKGIAEALDYIQAQMAAGTEISSLANGTGIIDLRGTPDNYRLTNVVYSSADKRLTLLSTGHDLHNDAMAQLNARFELTSHGAASAKGVIGCEGLNITGGGFIDSYDSSKGGYDLYSNSNSNVFAALVKGSSIDNLEGKPGQMKKAGLSVINGDFITFDGDIQTKGSGSIVSGNVTANGGIIINSNTSVGGNVTAKDTVTLNSSSSVGGNIHAGGTSENSVTFINNGSTVEGNVFANAVTLNGSGTVNGDVVSTGALVTNSGSKIKGTASAASAMLKGTIEGSLSVDASIIDTDNGHATVNGGVNYNATDRAKNTQPSIPEPGELTEYCKQNRAENTWLQQQLGTPPAGNNGELTKDNFTNMVSANNKTYSKLELTGENNDNRRVIEVTQNTTLYVTGEIKLTNLTIKISQGKNLTIKQVTPDNQTGRVVDMNDVAIVSMDGKPLGTANNGGVPPFSLYSNSTDRINIRAENHPDSNTPMYAAVYAPMARIELKDGVGDFAGALLGKYIDLTNKFGFHYDEALSNAANTGASTTLKLVSMLDAYPD